MGKLLRITDKVLIGLSIVGDVLENFDEIRPSKKKWHQSAFGFFPTSYKKRSYYSTISRMLSNKLIEKVIVDGQVILRISSDGKNKLTRDFPFLTFQNQKWDGKWRIVTFDIPIKKSNVRDRLRHKLKDLGFGMLQQSIWISPHNFEDDIREYLIENDLGKNAYVFVPFLNYNLFFLLSLPKSGTSGAIPKNSHVNSGTVTPLETVYGEADPTVHSPKIAVELE